MTQSASSRPNQFALLASRRFLPLFVTQFFGAFNDNVLKNALVVLVTYRLADAAGIDAAMLVNLAGGIFILPFFLFSATAGQLADRLEKSILIRIVKISEIGIVAVAVAGFVSESLALLLVALFLMGTHSTFFGPLKYAILPDHLDRSALIGATALIDAGTFLAILFGTILGGVLILAQGGVALTSTAMFVVAGLGLATCLFIPKAGPAAPNLLISRNFIAETGRLVRSTAINPGVRRAIWGISWFWTVGAVLLAQFPPLAKSILGADETVVALFLTTFSIGIGAGSLTVNRLLKGEITDRYGPIAAVGMALFAFDLYFASAAAARPEGAAFIGYRAFLAQPTGWRIVIDMLGISAAGGFFAVPLYTVLQTAAARGFRARAVAANNILNALAMVVSALALAAAFGLGWIGIVDVFLLVALGNIAVALFLYWRR